MRAFWDSDTLTFSIPAHNGGRGPAPEFAKWAGLQAARADLPTSHGIDTRNRASKVQSTAQELFADAVGAQQTRVLIETGIDRAERVPRDGLDPGGAPHRLRARRSSSRDGARQLRSRRGRDRPPRARAARSRRRAPERGRRRHPDFPSRPAIRSEAPMLPRDAFFAPTETVPFRDAIGRISAEL